MDEIKTNMDIGLLIAECTAYDFKVMLEESRPKSWLKSVSAFANTMGGSLFMTVIYSMEYDGGLNGQLSGTLNGTLSGSLNEKQKSVLDFIAATPGVQAQVLIDKLLIPRDTLNKIIKTLTDRGLIERRGSKKTGGYYVKKAEE